VFYQLYKQEVEARIAKRWQTLWVLRRGERLKRVREVGRQPQADLAGSQGVEGGRGVVWDHAAFFTRGRRWERGGRPTLLNPAERVLEEVLRWVEGRRYERIEARKAAVEAVP
jgi:transcriptional regulator with XRE-family HTH domain